MLHPVLFIFLSVCAATFLAVSIALKDTARTASAVFAGGSLFFTLLTLASI